MVCWTTVFFFFSLYLFLFLFICNDDRLSSQSDHLFWKAFIMISVNIYEEIKHSNLFVVTETVFYLELMH